MKVLVNGGLNLSELDGWWVEAYAPEVGWAIGDGREHGDDPWRDAADADSLYSILEREVIPEFYERDGRGIPAKWVARIRESMARLTPQYSANRAVREYTDHYYVPAAAAFNARADQHGKAGADLIAWQRKLAAEWNGVSFGPLKAESRDGMLYFEVPVEFGRLNPDDVRVELFANGPGWIGPDPKADGARSRAAAQRSSLFRDDRRPERRRLYATSCPLSPGRLGAARSPADRLAEVAPARAGGQCRFAGARH